MLKNYLKIALRNLLRYKIYSGITIISLAIGMTCAILILTYVRFELSYDQYHEKKDRLYRLVTRVEGSSFSAIAKVTGPWGVAAKNEIPEIEDMTRFVFVGQVLVSRGEKKFYESEGLYADSSVFSMFSFSLLKGERQSALAEPRSIVLTEAFAQKHFGDENPIGQALELDSRIPFKVTGVMENVPPSSHFTFPFLISMASLTHPDRDNWIRWNQFYTYLLLKEGAAVRDVEQKMSVILRNHMGDQGAPYKPFLQPLTSIHLHSNLFREMAPNSNVAYLSVLSAVGLFLLLIGCVNFMSLSTARAAKRAKEVGVRKVAGAGRLALSRQFLGESVLMSFLALLLSLALVDLALPQFSAMVQRDLSLRGAFDGWFVLEILFLAAFVGVLAGSYPAWILSSFKPTEILKGNWKGSKGVLFRKALVVFQFSVSALLLSATGVVHDQLAFIQNRELGFNEEQLIRIPIQDDSLRNKYESVKDKLLQYPSIISVSASANLPGGSDFGIPYQPEGFAPDQIPPARILVVDHDFIRTFEMTIAEGRDFSKRVTADASGAFIINEEAARKLGWEKPVGKTIAMAAIKIDPSPIVGVVKDFHFRSLHEPIAPLLMFIAPLPEWLGYFTVRVRPQMVNEALASIDRTWKEFDPSHPLTYTFFDEQFARLHYAEERMADAVDFFSVLAIVIACLGLFGLATFTAEQRTKEIGVRKVLGASVAGIAGLVSREFLKLVVIANILAWPVSYFVMRRWLEEFAYRTELEWRTFLLAAGVSVLVALLTVSYHSVKVAAANPVEALRYE